MQQEATTTKKIKKVFEPFPWQSLPEKVIIGVDEVGRGCLAGPVYAAAVEIDPSQSFKEFTDSKALSAKRREQLCEQIYRDHRVGVGFASVEEITDLNILQAALLAMKRAVENMGFSETEWKGLHLLVDGNQKVPNLPGVRQTTVVKGDLRAAPIAAASIVAKVTRDRLLSELASAYPEYGFEKHKGYSTVAHKKAIEQHGPTPLHRPTFAGVREFL